jgi:hypothetical protein
MYKIYLILLIILLLFGCNKDLRNSNENLDYNNDFKIIDKNFILDDEGKNSFVQIIVETKNSCEIKYDNHIISSSNNINNGLIIFMEQVNNKGNLDLWSICCNNYCKSEVQK